MTHHSEETITIHGGSVGEGGGENAALSCPFCQGSDLSCRKDYAEDRPGFVYAYHIFCNDCHAHGGNSFPIGWCESETAALERWNTRHQPMPKREIGGIVEAVAASIKAQVPNGYGMSIAEAEEYAQAAIRATIEHLRNHHSANAWCALMDGLGVEYDALRGKSIIDGGTITPAILAFFDAALSDLKES